MSWTHESLEAWQALTGGSPINLLKGDEVIAMRNALRHVPRNMGNAEYVKWRNDWVVQILNTREYIT